ncbi:MAG: divergent PAP2 family protein [Bacteroidales bacterium]|nr:divergent PAP2 family protein [Bacteroidales bacterium]
MGKSILGNNILDVVAVAWFVAQFLKVIHGLITDKKLYLQRFWETGGMPSSHSSTVASLTTAVGIVYGISSGLFAVSIVLAVIVMHDAVGIRRAAGKQAGVVNRMGTWLTNHSNEAYFQEELKELLGHKHIEVLAGAILGVLITLLMMNHLH